MDEQYRGEAGSRYFESYRSEFLDEELSKAQAAKIGAWARSPERVLDFGCSSGLITHFLPGRSKNAVEVNETAAKIAREKFVIEVRPSIGDYSDDDFDVVVSHHSLEHVRDPFHILCEMFRVLRPGGRAIIYVPGESAWKAPQNKWHEEINKHLFNWTPLSLGNLMQAAGFTIERSGVSSYTWRSHHLGPLNTLPGTGLVLGLWRKVWKGETEVYLVAVKPAA
jgi:SAM-dependent methyltransferase